MLTCHKCHVEDSPENPVSQRFEDEPESGLPAELVTWCDNCFKAGMLRVWRAVFHGDGEIH
jgi:hypothetical protein